MMWLTLLLVVFCTNVGVVVTRCDRNSVKYVYAISTMFYLYPEGKTTCITEDLLQMIMKTGTCSYRDINERPVFFASLTKDTTLSGVNDVVKFDDVKINVGRGYDRNTGVFTAPRNGVYVISCLILGRKSSEVHFQLNKNNDLYTGGYVSNINYGSNTLNSFLNLKKGDRVYIKHRINAVQNINGHHFSTFSGYLLSE